MNLFYAVVLVLGVSAFESNAATVPPEKVQLVRAMQSTELSAMYWDGTQAQYAAQDLASAASDAQYSAENEYYSAPSTDPDRWRKSQAVSDLRSLAWDARDLAQAIRSQPESADASRSSFNQVRSSFRWAETDVQWAHFSSRVESDFWRAQSAYRRLEMMY